MKNIARLLPLMAMAMGAGIHLEPEQAMNLSEKQIDELREKRRKIIDEKHAQNRINKYNLKEFKYGDEVIHARNQKNADRKAKKKGLIN